MKHGCVLVLTLTVPIALRSAGHGDLIGLTAEFDVKSGYLLVESEGVLGKQHRGKRCAYHPYILYSTLQTVHRTCDIGGPALTQFFSPQVPTIRTATRSSITQRYQM